MVLYALSAVKEEWRLLLQRRCHMHMFARLTETGSAADSMRAMGNGGAAVGMNHFVGFSSLAFPCTQSKFTARKRSKTKLAHACAWNWIGSESDAALVRACHLAPCSHTCSCELTPERRVSLQHPSTGSDSGTLE